MLLLFAVSFSGLAVQGGAATWQNLPAAVQFVPGLLGTLAGKPWAWAVLVVLLGLTLVWGRVYCSWICPLGMLQDLVRRIHPARWGRYTPNRWIVRCIFGLLGFGSLACGSVAVLTWLDPYTITARAATAFWRPLAGWVGGAGADMARYSPWLWLLAAAGLLLPLVMAFFRGRLYCNTVCPVGALLGLVSRCAPCTPRIDMEDCVHCGACMRACKANAIDIRNGRVDSTRCVACYNCLSGCGTGAMNLYPRNPFAKPAPKRKAHPAAKKPRTAVKKNFVDLKARAAAPAAEAPAAAGQGADAAPAVSRRAVLGLGLLGAATAVLPARAAAPAQLTDNPAEPGNNTAPAAIPPGGRDVDRFLDHCTGCGLCMANCPTGVLRPSYLAHGLGGFMKPYMNLTDYRCDDSCTRCSTICPEGALLPLDLAEKRTTQIGLCAYTQARCDIWTQGKECGRCAKACPTGALQLETLLIPVMLSDKCVGCKRCMRVCPHQAIHMEQRADGSAYAVVDFNLCIGCGACSQACGRHKAIESRPIDTPYLKPARCIGCGACAAACPATPQKAMQITPRRRHLQAKPRKK